MFKVKLWDGTSFDAKDKKEAVNKAKKALQGWCKKTEGNWIGTWEDDKGNRIHCVMDRFHLQTDVQTIITATTKDTQ
jgi:hypothetical protein